MENYALVHLDTTALSCYYWPFVIGLDMIVELKVGTLPRPFGILRSRQFTCGSIDHYAHFGAPRQGEKEDFKSVWEVIPTLITSSADTAKLRQMSGDEGEVFRFATVFQMCSEE